MLNGSLRLLCTVLNGKIYKQHVNAPVLTLCQAKLCQEDVWKKCHHISMSWHSFCMWNQKILINGRQNIKFKVCAKFFFFFFLSFPGTSGALQGMFHHIFSTLCIVMVHVVRFLRYYIYCDKLIEFLENTVFFLLDE